MKYKKPESSKIRGICVICNKNLQKKVASQNKYRPICSVCDKKLYATTQNKTNQNRRIDIHKRPYRKYVKTFCEQCGFIPEHICQLDVDHIDANHKNNAPENLQTLCANCHRLKTHRERFM